MPEKLIYFIVRWEMEILSTSVGGGMAQILHLTTGVA
jgi:hypothetical protein